MKAKIKTHEDLQKIAEEIAQIIGTRPVEVTITLPENEYLEYINNKENTFESFLNKNEMLPMFKSTLNDSNRSDIIKSFLHRSGVKLNIRSFYQG